MKHVLVTGASSGIGEATAIRLAHGGMQVFAGMRNIGESEELQSAGGAGIRPIELDVTDLASISSAIAHIAAEVRDDGLAGVVNNAGEGYPGPLEALDLDDLRSQLEVNVIGQVAVTQVALPLIRRGHGRVVFVGSIGGKFAVEFGGAYHASKFAMEAIADSWRQELAPENIAVAIIEPGTTSTGIWEKAAGRIDTMLETPAAWPYRDRLIAFKASLQKADRNAMPAEKVAEAIEQALTQPRPASRYPVGAAAKLGYRLKPFIPDRIYDRVARHVVT